MSLNPTATGVWYNVSVVDVWAVHQGDDDRHNGFPRWFFTDESKAKLVAKNRGWWGGDAPISNQKAIVLDGNIAYLLSSEEPIPIDIGPETEKEMRQKALDKLSKEERELLGLE